MSTTKTPSSTPIAQLHDGLRTSVIGNILNLQVVAVSGGEKKKLEFEVQDASGTIKCIGFDEAAKVWGNGLLVVGQTYKIYAQARTNNLRNILELKIWPDTRFDKVEQQTFETAEVDVQTLKGMPRGKTRGILCQLDDKETLSNGTVVRRSLLVDKSDTLTAFLTGELADQPELVDGVCVVAEGPIRMLSAGPFFYVEKAERVEDATLVAHWQATKDSQPAKKKRVNLTNLAEVRDAPEKMSSDFKAVVRSRALASVPWKDGHKFTITVVDSSSVAVDLTIFCASESPFDDIAIGSVIKFNGKISGYNGRSLWCKEYEIVEDAALSAWWTQNSGAAFDELSVDTRSGD